MYKIAHWLLIIGGLNWLLVGALKWDIGSLVGGMESWPARIIYILIGISAILSFKQCGCKNCQVGSGTSAPSQM